MKRIFNPTVIDFHLNARISKSLADRILSFIGKEVEVFPNYDTFPIESESYKGQYRWMIKGLEVAGWFPCEDFYCGELSAEDEIEILQYLHEALSAPTPKKLTR